MKKSMMLAGAFLLVCVGMQDPMASERASVERTVLDYVEGVYEVKPEWIERSVHPKLAKIGYARRSADEAWHEIPMTFEQLVELAREYNADGHIPKDAIKKIEILDLLNKTASVKLTANWGIDYMHLVKYEGKWKIVQVLWQTDPNAERK